MWFIWLPHLGTERLSSGAATSGGGSPDTGPWRAIPGKHVGPLSATSTSKPRLTTTERLQAGWPQHRSTLEHGNTVTASDLLGCCRLGPPKALSGS